MALRATILICGLILACGLLHPRIKFRHLEIRRFALPNGPDDLGREPSADLSREPSAGHDLKMILGFAQVANLCDAPPQAVVSALTKQGRRDVRVEQRTLDELGVRFNVIEYKGYVDASHNFTRVRVISIRGTKTLRNFFSNAGGYKMHP